MTRRIERVRYHLDAHGIRSLQEAEIRAILRGADDLIMHGGRSLLVKVLKGSRSKDVIEKELDQSPVHGYLKLLTPEEVLAHIDWVILNGYMALEYNGRLPLLIYTPKGWAIEREAFANELLWKLSRAAAGQEMFDMSSLKDKNREMILLLLDKLEASGDSRFIPLLLAWEQIDYKKVRQRIRSVIERLSGVKSEAQATAQE